VMAETGVDEETAASALEASNWSIKSAVGQIHKPQIHTEEDG